MRVAVGGILVASLSLVGAGTTLAAGGGSTTCAGGPVAGSYASLVVTGTCEVVAPATVSGNLSIAPGGELLAAFSDASLSVMGNLSVGTNAVAVLGCEPEAFPCLDDPGAIPTKSASVSIGGNLSADGALAVLIHNAQVGRNLAITGGGGGVNCDPQSALLGSPAYATVEDVTVTGNASITGWQSCWLGFIRTTVGGNVNFSGNVVFDPDGNEVVTNTIAGNLNCSGNSPAPQVGDSTGNLNSVSRKATGQCVGLTN